MKTLNYRLILTPEPEGGYTVRVPAIRGCVTYGETLEEAIAMARDAIEGCLEVLVEEGQPIPPDDSNTFEYSLNLVTELV
ncbi:type II toxin-antitoxin system HicB family antitoxin [Spirosoma koreense]